MCISASLQRMRPIIDDSLGYKVILTDRSNLLRGVSLAFDGGDPFGSKPIIMPDANSFKMIRTEYGLNTIHVYLEGNSSTNTDPVGINLKYADYLVNITRDIGLYLIITIGCNGENGTIHSFDKALNFWSLYANRYKDESHVIFEAHNEPVGWTLNNFTEDDWNKQLILYKHIRKLAPESLILLGSFMSFYDPNNTPDFGAKWLSSNGVSWDNTAFAFHGYWDMAQVEETIRLFKNDRSLPALLCTEFNPYDTEKGFNNMCESHLIGWMQFEWFSNNSDLLGFKGKIEKAGTIWKPEINNCNWPSHNKADVPGLNQPFGIMSRSTGKYLGIESNKIVPKYERYFALDDQNFFLEYLGSNFIALKNSKGEYLTTESGSNKLIFKHLAPHNIHRFIWMNLRNGDIALRSFAENSKLVSVSDKSPIGSLELCGDSSQFMSSSTFYIAKDVDSRPNNIFSYSGYPYVVPSEIHLPAVDFDHFNINSTNILDTKEGDMYRKDYGVDIGIDDHGSPIIEHFENGEILNYTIYVKESGTYYIELQVASPFSNKWLDVLIDDLWVLKFDLPRTNSWNKFESTKPMEINLSKGINKLTIVSAGGFNFKSLIIRR